MPRFVSSLPVPTATFLAALGVTVIGGCASASSILNTAKSAGSLAGDAAKALDEDPEAADSGGGSGSTLAAVVSGEPVDPVRAVGQARAAKIEAMSDVELAELAAKMLLGELNTVEGFTDDPNDTRDLATGDLTPAYVAEDNVLKGRISKLLMAKYGASNDGELTEKILPDLYCFEEARFEGRLDDDAKSECQKRRYKGRKSFSYEDPVLVSLLLEGVIHPLPAADQQAWRDKLVSTLGYERKVYKYDSVDSLRPGISNKQRIWGVQLVERPLSEWTFRTVRFAHEYAALHELDAKTVATMKTQISKAPRYQCRKLEGVYFIQDHEGGGRYGDKYAGSWMLNGADVVDCKKAKKAKKTGWAFKLLKDADGYRSVDKWLSAKTEGRWRVEKDKLGYPTRKVQEATIYWREEI